MNRDRAAVSLLSLFLGATASAAAQSHGITTNELSGPDKYGNYRLQVMNTTGHVPLVLQYIYLYADGRSDASGMDALANYVFGSHAPSPTDFVRPPYVQTFVISAREKDWYRGVRMLFRDGHCEQSIPGNALCDTLVYDERSIYNEVLRLRNGTALLPADSQQFSESLLSLLKTRRAEIYDPKRSLFPDALMRPRVKIIDDLMLHIQSQPDLDYPDLKTRAAALAFFNQWLAFFPDSLRD